MAFGFDCGTYNLVCCKRDKDKNFVYKKEINAFIELPLTQDKFVFNMMKDSGVPLIEWEEAGIAYALGEAAVKMAYTMSNLDLKRPMINGCLNPKEKHAQQIMNIMIHSLIESCEPSETMYYSVPANAVNQETDIEYHSLVLKSMFQSFEDDNNRKLNPNPINEALALIYAELKSKAYTGIGISWGSGMVNMSFAIYGSPVFSFSMVNSGDWIDKQTAKATGESIAYINQEKTKLNLLEDSTDIVQKALKMQYEIMMQKTIQEIKKGMELSGSKARTGKPLDFVIAGGTSMPIGFEKVFEKMVKNANLPIDIGGIIKPSDPLFSVARGCLLAAEASKE